MTLADKPRKADPTEALTRYHWEPQPQAAAFVKKVVEDFLEKLPEAKAFAERLYRETGNRFGDLVARISLSGTGRPDDPSATRREIEAAGWRYVEPQAWKHPGGIFPLILLSPKPQIHLHVENLIDFMAANGLAWHHNSEWTQRLAPVGSPRGLLFAHNEQAALYFTER